MKIRGFFGEVVFGERSGTVASRRVRCDMAFLVFVSKACREGRGYRWNSTKTGTHVEGNKVNDGGLMHQ